MKHIVICDDDPIFAAYLSSEVERYYNGLCKVQMFESAEELRAAQFQIPPDIALLDIRLDEECGIDLARELFPGRAGTAVIFITGYMEYCTDIYEADHIYFLLKPLDPVKLSKALHKADSLSLALPAAFPVRVGTEVRRISFDSVIYIESFYRKLRITTTDETIETYGTISALAEAASRRLIHCHKSFMVNPSYIETMSTDTFLLTSGKEIPISHSKRSESREQFLAYLASQMEGN